MSVVSVNATVEQWITLPALRLSGWRGVSLGWSERRSSTHNSSVTAGFSTGQGEPFEIFGRMDPPGHSLVLPRLVPLPDSSWGDAGVILRLMIDGNGTGATGTIRLDDLVVTGSPGRDLSVSVPDDGPNASDPAGGVLLRGLVRNNGYEQGPEATVRCFSSAVDSGAGWVFLSDETIAPLAPGDSVPVEFTIELAQGRAVDILLVCESEGDLVASNDSATAIVRMPVRPHAVVINEIMYDPLPGRAEYVELLNVTAEEIDVGPWRLSDSDDDTGSDPLAPGTLILGPGGYLLCSPGTDLPGEYPGIPATARVVTGMRSFTLNNGGDILALTDDAGRVVDRLEYLPSWHTPALDDPSGRSLEKIDPASPGDESWNWGSSPDPSGGTPGRHNLLSNAPPAGNSARVTCRPDPFSPDGDGFEDATTVGFTTGGPSAVVRVRMFDSDGRPVRTLTRGSYIGESSSVVWNGFDDDGRKAGIGIYIVVVEGVAASGERAFLAKGTVVVAGKL